MAEKTAEAITREHFEEEYGISAATSAAWAAAADSLKIPVELLARLMSVRSEMRSAELRAREYEGFIRDCVDQGILWLVVEEFRKQTDASRVQVDEFDASVGSATPQETRSSICSRSSKTQGRAAGSVSRGEGLSRRRGGGSCENRLGRNGAIQARGQEQVRSGDARLSKQVGTQARGRGKENRVGGGGGGGGVRGVVQGGEGLSRRKGGGSCDDRLKANQARGRRQEDQEQAAEARRFGSGSSRQGCSSAGRDRRLAVRDYASSSSGGGGGGGSADDSFGLSLQYGDSGAAVDRNSKVGRPNWEEGGGAWRKDFRDGGGGGFASFSSSSGYTPNEENSNDVAWKNNPRDGGGGGGGGGGSGGGSSLGSSRSGYAFVDPVRKCLVLSSKMLDDDESEVVAWKKRLKDGGGGGGGGGRISNLEGDSCSSSGCALERSWEVVGGGGGGSTQSVSSSEVQGDVAEQFRYAWREESSVGGGDSGGGSGGISSSPRISSGDTDLLFSASSASSGVFASRRPICAKNKAATKVSPGRKPMTIPIPVSPASSSGSNSVCLSEKNSATIKNTINTKTSPRSPLLASNNVNSSAAQKSISRSKSSAAARSKSFVTSQKNRFRANQLGGGGKPDSTSCSPSSCDTTPPFSPSSDEGGGVVSRNRLRKNTTAKASPIPRVVSRRIVEPASKNSGGVQVSPPPPLAATRSVGSSATTHNFSRNSRSSPAPRTIGRTPESNRRTPESIGKTPVGRTPESIGKTPVGRTPESIGRAQGERSIGRSPESIELIGRAPESIRRAPPRAMKASRNYSAIPQSSESSSVQDSDGSSGIIGCFRRWFRPPWRP